MSYGQNHASHRIKYRRNPRKSLKVVKKKLVHTSDDMPIADIMDVRTGLLGLRTFDGSIVRTEEFDERYFYGGDLGIFYTKEKTRLRVWAPTAQLVEVEIWESLLEGAPITARLPMKFRDPGVWEMELLGDQAGTVYTYHLTFSDGTNHSSMDPYSTAVVANGEKTVILDPETVQIANFERMPPFTHPTDAVIYEMNVRDFSTHPDSGIYHKGKFLGVVEAGTTNGNGSSTGLDYLKELGVTHVQLLPIYDYATVDEFYPADHYNWGYDPKNFNVPEGSYATDPLDPPRRIIELKEMIRGLHEAGLRVIMDVVYNHVYEVSMHSLHKTVPGYFFRYDDKGRLSNGSGVGNDTASERRMMRKYILDSIRFWLEEYKVDGFRFDLMGIHDIDTMNEIRLLVDAIDPSIILLGEGWNMNTTLPSERRASQGNAERMPRIAHFNDVIRDAVRGSMFHPHETGFVSGGGRAEERLSHSLSGSPYHESGASYQEPGQLIQYVEAHDNLTLYDRLCSSRPKDSEQTRIRRHTLASSIVLLAQGVPFIHGGQEFLRTKYGDENSYRSGDFVNRFDWGRQDEYQEALDYFRDLVAFRRAHPLLRLKDYSTISSHYELLQSDNHIISFSLSDASEELIIIFNAREDKAAAAVKPGSWEVLIWDMAVQKQPETWELGRDYVRVEPLCVTVLKRKKPNGLH